MGVCIWVGCLLGKDARSNACEAIEKQNERMGGWGMGGD